MIYYKSEREEVLQQLHSDEKGLSQSQVEAARAECGFNELAEKNDIEGIRKYLAEYQELSPEMKVQSFCRNGPVNAVLNHYNAMQILCGSYISDCTCFRSIRRFTINNSCN